jgi:hypothetical protein
MIGCRLQLSSEVITPEYCEHLKNFNLRNNFIYTYSIHQYDIGRVVQFKKKNIKREKLRRLRGNLGFYLNSKPGGIKTSGLFYKFLTDPRLVHKKRKKEILKKRKSTLKILSKTIIIEIEN